MSHSSRFCGAVPGLTGSRQAVMAGPTLGFPSRIPNAEGGKRLESTKRRPGKERSQLTAPGPWRKRDVPHPWALREGPQTRPENSTLAHGQCRQASSTQAAAAHFSAENLSEGLERTDESLTPSEGILRLLCSDGSVTHCRVSFQQQESNPACTHVPCAASTVTQSAALSSPHLEFNVERFLSQDRKSCLGAFPGHVGFSGMNAP